MNVGERPTEQALTGIRVIDLSSYVAGPYCSMLLGDAGATVLKLERKGIGDGARYWGADQRSGDSKAFATVNRNKYSLEVDFGDADDLALAQRLCGEADIIVESLGAATADKLGLDYASTSARNRSIIHCSVSAYGRDNSREECGGFDGILQAYVGILKLLNGSSDVQRRVPISAIDLMTGTLAYGAVVTALAARERIGGQYIDLSLFDAAVNLLGSGIPEAGSREESAGKRPANEAGWAFPYGIYDAADGKVYLGVGNDGAWQRFCRSLELDALADAPEYRRAADRLTQRDVLRGAVLAALRSRTSREIVELMDAARVPCSAIRSPIEMIEDPFSQERGVIEWRDGTEGERVPFAASPLRLSKTPGTTWRLPPGLGRDNTSYQDEWYRSSSDG